MPDFASPEAAVPQQKATRGDTNVASASAQLFDDFCRSCAYAAIQEPISGVAQLTDQITGSTFQADTHFLERPEQADFGTARWHAQTAGSAVGMLIPFSVVHAGVGKVLPKGGLSSLGAGNALRLSLAEAATTGFIYDSVLRPSDPSKDFLTERLTNGAVGAANFATLSATSAGVSALARTETATTTHLRNALSNPMFNGAVSSIPASLVTTTAEIARGNMEATPQNFAQSAYSAMFSGAALGVKSELQRSFSRKENTQSLATEENLGIEELPEARSFTSAVKRETPQESARRANFADEVASSKKSHEARAQLEFRGLLEVINDPNQAQTESARTERAKVYLDRHAGAAFDADVQSWIQRQPRSELRSALEEYYRNDQIQLTRKGRLLEEILEGEAQKSNEPEVQSELRSAVQTFAKRSATDQLTDKQQLSTLSNALGLFETGHTEASVQVLLQAADPRVIIQGPHPTCSLNTMEVWMYKNFPEKASEAVLSVLRDGSLRSGSAFFTADGSRVWIRPFSLKPEAGSLDYLARVDRSYASQVFQMAAANIHRQLSENKEQFFGKVPDADAKSGYLRKDMVDRLNPTFNGTPAGANGFSAQSVQEVARQMGATRQMEIVRAQFFATPQALAQHLENLSPRQFPVWITVDAGPLANLNTPPQQRNHAIPILGIKRDGQSHRVQFLDNWLLRDLDQRTRTGDVRDVWRISHL